ncbi:hypothetical protein E2986_03097 [Frieseomelitta varia]|uniref:Uncharacterized protein n=1 Tax=Frieseomelitta varia TaxID=561572 RepID=A0A833RKS8_9HYME|nr:hypothetical protein E2986_03097 [Frieseomelitta varia]
MSYNEEELKMLQQLLPNASPETIRNFQLCMKTDAVYRCGIPCGLVSGIAMYFMAPIPSGIMKKCSAILVGTLMSAVARAFCGPMCYQKALSIEKKQLGQFGDFDQQEQQSKYLVSPGDNLEEEKPVWDSFDTRFENMDEFNDTNDNNLQQELRNEPQEKARVTYDDLWIQHREQQMKNSIQKLRTDLDHNYSLNAEKRESFKRQQKRLPKESTETEFEKDTWN